MVIAGGQAYIIEPSERRLVSTTRGLIEEAILVPSASLIILNSGICLEAWNSERRQWRTEHILWGGIHNLVVNNATIQGEACTFEDRRVPFFVDLETGKVGRGSY